MKWENEIPPVGIWTWCMEEGLFRIERKMGTGYIEITRVCRFQQHQKIEISTRYTVFIYGPFLYPLPDPLEYKL